MAIETKHRESNIELFRIIMMLLIVAHHYVVDSGLLGMIAEPPYTWKHYFLYVFGMWGKIGINCFVLITGYFMCKSEISVKKFLKLLFEICFYYIVIYLIFVLCGYEELSAYGIYYALNPCKQIANSFTSCFLIYYLLIPFLNVMVNHLTKIEHALLIAICITFFVIWDRLPGVIYYYNYVGWFCVLHVIASYIRFYLPKYMEKAHNRHEVFRMAVWGGAFAVLTVIGQCIMIEKGWNMSSPYKWVVDCNAIAGVISSVMMFIGFKNMRLKYSPIINSIAASTFGVLLIHANSDAMRKWLWYDTLNNMAWCDTPYMVLHAIGSVATIFIICIAIDKVRIYALEKPTFKLIDKVLAKYGLK